MSAKLLLPRTYMASGFDARCVNINAGEFLACSPSMADRSPSARLLLDHIKSIYGLRTGKTHITPKLLIKIVSMISERLGRQNAPPEDAIVSIKSLM